MQCQVMLYFIKIYISGKRINSNIGYSTEKICKKIGGEQYRINDIVRYFKDKSLFGRILQIIIVEDSIFLKMKKYKLQKAKCGINNMLSLIPTETNVWIASDKIISLCCVCPLELKKYADLGKKPSFLDWEKEDFDDDLILLKY